MKIFKSYTQKDFEFNLLLLSSNPLMSICLTVELLYFIAKSRIRFESDCLKIVSDLLKLGSIYISKIEDEAYYEKLMFDRDFRCRPVLKLIIDTQLPQLMPEHDVKAENLMVKLWEGGDATGCDGNLFGYSNLYYVLWTDPKKPTKSD